MTIVTFDTLKLAKRLETAGFSRDQASGTAEALADTFSTELATKTDIAALRADLKGDIAALRADSKGDIAGTRGDLSKLGADLRTELATLSANTARSIADLRTSTAQWIISAVLLNFVGLLGVAFALWQALRR